MTSTSKLFRLFACACALAVVPEIVSADDATTDSPASAAASIPPPDCPEPVLPPRLSPSERSIEAFNRQYASYQTCMNAYIQAEKAKTKEYGDLANAHLKAGNDAIQKFNDLVNRVKDNSASAP